jgi:hypothetical protein
MRVIVLVEGPPTEAGAWPMSIGIGESRADQLPPLVPGGRLDVGRLTSGISVVGEVYRINRVADDGDLSLDDEKLIVTVLADSLALPAGWDDWRVLLAPDVLVEEAEAFLAEQAGEEPWSW